MAELSVVTRETVEAYLSTPVVVDTLDDDNNGSIDNASMDRVIADSEAIFYASVRGSYELPFVAPADPFAVTVVLHIIHCQLVKRFPERFRKGVDICEEAKELLKQIRSGELVLSHPPKGGLETAGPGTVAGPECFSLPQRMPEPTGGSFVEDYFYRRDND